jgi:hypothetical protein
LLHAEKGLQGIPALGGKAGRSCSPRSFSAYSAQMAVFAAHS